MGRLYVDKAISEMMRDRLLPLADIITPNQFELGLLADTAITGETDAIAAARRLLGGRLQTVFVTAYPQQPDRLLISWFVQRPKC